MNMMVLDGGMGHLLKEWGVRTDGLPYEQQFLAGVMANTSDPETVKRAHRCYVTAGAGCITTNNFAATRHNLAKVQMQTAATELVQFAGSRSASQISGWRKPTRRCTCSRVLTSFM